MNETEYHEASLEDNYIIDDMRSAGLRYFQSILRDFTPTDVHRMATVLHPILKKLRIVPSDERIEAYKFIDIKIREIQPESKPTAVTLAAASTFNVDFLNEFIATQGEFTNMQFFKM